MIPAFAVSPRNGLTKLFPSLTVSYLITLLLLVAGSVWISFSARDVGHPSYINLPKGLSTGEAISLAGPSHLADFTCGETKTGAGGLSICAPGQPLLVNFTYWGRKLWLELQRGEALGQLLVTVDGQPANLIKVRATDQEDNGTRAGRLPLLSPFEHASMRPDSEWIPIHVAKSDGPHTVSLKIESRLVEGRSLPSGAILKAAGVDIADTFNLPSWPGLLLALVGGFGFTLNLLAIANWPKVCQLSYLLVRRSLRFLHAQLPSKPIGLGVLTGLGFSALALGHIQQSWWVSLAGIVILGLGGLQRPAIWLGSVLLGLPFYLYPIPLLPGFALSLVEIGVSGGLILVLLQYIRSGPLQLPSYKAKNSVAFIVLGLLAFTFVALFSATEAHYWSQALREWRTVFLAAFGFLMALIATLRMSKQRESDVALLIAMWIGGAVAISLFGFYAYMEGVFVTEVDGVRRIRGLYGSPNNLALYLDRTLLVSITFFLFAQTWPRRLLWTLLTAVQAGAMLLTFSKGGLFLGLPAGLLFLFGTAFFLRKYLPEARTVLWLLVGVAALGLMSLVPFLNTPRFAGLLTWQESLPNLVRVHLWHSGLKMFLDNWILGVGPDNFLYWYRGNYIDPAVWHEPNLNHPHNFLIDLLSRLGLAGLFSAFVFFAVGFLAICNQIRASAPSKVSIGLAAACVAGLAHGLVDASYALPDLILTWVLLLGLACLLDLKQTESLLI